MINFNLHSFYEGIHGLIFEFALPPNKDEVWSKTSKYLTEGAFYFIEGFISEHVPKYKEFGHWGITDVNKEQWLFIKPQLLLLKDKVDAAQNLEEINHDLLNFGHIFEEYLEDMINGFSIYKPLFSKMISDFITWIDDSMEEYGEIYILGV